MMGSNFEYTTNLQYKVKHLTSQLESFLSGEKYVSMEQNFQKQLSGKNRKIKNLKSELGRHIVRQSPCARTGWKYSKISQKNTEKNCVERMMKSSA